jgi:hypothetical protein
MTLTHQIFDIFAFTVALLELIHLYREGKISGRRWVVPMLIALLLGFGSVVGHGWAEQKSALTRAETQIIESLESDARTFDELAHRLSYRELPLASEALDELISSGRVMYEDVRLAQPDDSIPHEVRLYHLRKSQPQLNSVSQKVDHDCATSNDDRSELVPGRGRPQ